LPLASISEKYINYDKVAAWRKPPEFSAYRVFIVEKYPKKLKGYGRICLSVAQSHRTLCSAIRPPTTRHLEFTEELH
jgi:hypothetical protein